MERIYFCLIWTTILYAIDGQLNGDPAPGRSPGPPIAANLSVSLITNSTIKNYRSNAANAGLKINDVLFESEYDDAAGIVTNDNQQITTLTNTNTDNKKLVDSVNNINIRNKNNNASNDVIVDKDAGDSRDDEADYDTISVQVETELPVSRKSCNGANARQEYLNQNDGRATVTQKHDDTASTRLPTTSTPLPAAAVKPAPATTLIHFDVTHDVFDIGYGLVNNIVYLVHLYMPKNESVADFYIESLVNNVSAGRFVPTLQSDSFSGGRHIANTPDQATYRRSRPNGDNGGALNGKKSKHYGNEKTAWDRQHTYPLSVPPADANNHHRVRPNANAMRALRVDESGIEYLESPASANASGKSNVKTSNATLPTANATAAADAVATNNKNVNKRRKRVEKWNNNEAQRCANEQMWSESMGTGDGVEHSVRHWIYNSTSYANKTVSFRIYYRIRGNADVFELSSEFRIRSDCKLFIRDTMGTLDHSLLPNIDYESCTVYFPSQSPAAAVPAGAAESTATATATAELPGLLVQLTRLNVPCDNGGYIIFTDQNYLCGKLEDLDANERSYYFPLHLHTNVVLHKNPMFSMTFKLVDYCYNMTLIERNTSILLEPRDVFECYFKIHLPYGNRIELDLYANLQREAIDRNGHLDTSSATTSLEYELGDLNVSQILTSNNRFGNDCRRGITIQVEEGNGKSWLHCVHRNVPARRFLFRSNGNTMVVRVSRREAYDISMLDGTMSVYFEYKAVSIPDIVSQCAFGWVAVHQFCIAAIENALPWTLAEDECKKLGGHLASIKSEREQRIIDAVLLNSVAFKDSAAYWVGASDEIFEGEFRWSNGFPYTYSNWFPGWSEHNNYNKQPNDDGLSGQDCVELRRYFRIPPAIQSKSKTIPLSLSYMWNDRDCNEKNFFLCERPMSVEPVEKSWTMDCNKTIMLTRDHPRVSVWSPGFPRHYPDKANCFIVVIAPKGYQIVLEFEELVIESEPECSYDYLEIIDTHYSESSRIYPHNSRHSFSRSFNSNASRHDPHANGTVDFFQNFLSIYKEHTSFLIQTPDMNQAHDAHFSIPTIPRRICGDWNSKVKLLRRISNGPVLGLHFSSDYSHHFGGYKAKVSIKNVASECSDDRLKAYNGSCYLFVSYPEVDWYTAQQICSGIHGELTSIATPEEQRFVVTSIRNQLDYSPQAIYWIGGQIIDNEFKWLDGSDIAFKGWVPGQEPSMNASKEPSCLGLQWKMSPTKMLPSGLFWASQRCNKFGGYACKKKSEKSSFENGKNYTVTGLQGEFTSPNFPKHYPINSEYWVKIVGPKRTRIVIHFTRIDMEEQNDCLYDYVRVQDDENYSNNLEPGESTVPIAMLSDDESPKIYQNSDYRKRHLVKRDTKAIESNIATNNRAVSNQGPTFLPYVRWCGMHESNLSRFDFISATNVALVNFHSDYSITGTGFALSWKAVDISGCPTQTFASNEMNMVITSPNYPNFLLNNLDCTYNIYAPTGRKVWLEFSVFEVMRQGSVEIDLGNGPFVPFRNSRQLNDGVFVSLLERMTIRLRTGFMPKGKGFRATFKTMTAVERRSINLLNNTYGTLFHLNYPQPIPPNIDFTQHLIAPLGDVILLELYNVGFNENGCQNGDSIEIYDNYADNNGTYWSLCELPIYDESSDIDPYVIPSPIHITSYLNTLHIRQRTTLNLNYLKLNASIRIQPDFNYKYKLATGNDEVETCYPNPCQYGGKCVASGNFRRCQCTGHYTGRFCGLTMCEIEPCFFGKCELTPNNFKCHCQTGYIGRTCDQKQRPCANNPCESRGECFEKNGKFHCRCHAWWEGAKCERRMLHIPYKPLSERMLQEPFWLGLITVFVVMAFIGLVWCAKRHFPEKIEKLLSEEADRNRPSGSLHGHHLGHHHPSLREQLQFTITNSAPQSTATTPGAPRTIFGRLGIRKPSILSLSSPQAPGGATARTFSLDDLLRPPPRRTPSPRKKRNNSTPTKKNAAEKKQILQQLISPAAQQARAKMSLDDLMIITDNRIQMSSALDADCNLGETTFCELASGAKLPLNDPKLEKKVTFARLMSKVSAEMSSGSEVDAEIGTHTLASLRLQAPTDPIPRPSSVPPTPSCTHEIRSPHSTSSNQGSDSLSGSEQTLNDDFALRLNRRIKPKVSSADSILAMFRNFASTNVISHIPSSMIISPSTTPSASSPQDGGDDESSTSSMHTPVSFTSCAPDSPVSYHMQSTSIEVPVIDSYSAHKSSSASNSSGSNSNLLNPPSILLEIPSNINKCLSPIREMPTPIPSPALTPIMPRYHRFSGPQSNVTASTTTATTIQADTYSNHFSDDDERITVEQTEKHPSDLCLTGQSDAAATKASRSQLADSNDIGLPNRHTPTIVRPIPRPPTVQISIDIEPPSNELRSPNRPKNLVIPQLIVQQASPTKERLPVMYPGSPPPQRASVGETNFFMPNVTTKSQQKRHLKDLDKPASLEFPFAPPMITITTNMADLESDADTLSPINSKASGCTLGLPNSGMCYLSPFSIVTRGDRTASEGNLSSSGYSSMASPGPSRCGSSTLCTNEMDDSGAGHPGPSVHPHRLAHGRRLNGQQTDADSFHAKSDVNEQRDRVRRRMSDSETLSDDILIESNDEGIETDHIDEKIEDGVIKSAKELEIYIGKELVDNGKDILLEEPIIMSQLQLPSIVIQGEGTEKGISPVSSRSESPISERANSMSRFSPLFYNRKEQQLPFTDSDGLYDFPSSDGKGKSVRPQHCKKSSVKKRDRKSSRAAAGAHVPSPTKSILFDIPFKETSPSMNLSNKHHAANRKSPKRRPIQRPSMASSSSSTESLTTASKARFGAILREKRSIKQLEYCTGPGVDTEEDVSSQILPRADMESIKSNRKLGRLRAIGNQIRFLRRLEKSIKRRHQHHPLPHEHSEVDSIDGEDENDSDVFRAATSPLLKSKPPSHANPVITKSAAIKPNVEALSRNDGRLYTERH